MTHQKRNGELIAGAAKLLGGPRLGGLGAQMQQPLAVAVIGGFVVALPLLLFVLPTGMRLIYRHIRLPEAAEPVVDKEHTVAA